MPFRVFNRFSGTVFEQHMIDRYTRAGSGTPGSYNNENSGRHERLSVFTADRSTIQNETVITSINLYEDAYFSFCIVSDKINNLRIKDKNV